MGKSSLDETCKWNVIPHQDYSCSFFSDYGNGYLSISGGSASEGASMKLGGTFGESVAWVISAYSHTHSYEKGNTVAATCTTDGYTVYTCADCGHSVNRDVVTAPGHDYEVQEFHATCTTTAHNVYTCKSCGDSYQEDVFAGWTDWSTTPPEGVEEGQYETRTVYRYSDRSVTTSTETSMAGYTQISSTWVQSGSGNVDYATFPSGYSTSHATYTKYNKTPPKASETETTKTTVGSATRIGYLYWHWCYNHIQNDGSTWYGDPVFRWINNAYTSRYTGFHATYSTDSPVHCGSSNYPDWYYRYDTATCTDTTNYYYLDVYRQSYTNYVKEFTYEKWSDWSAWSASAVTASDNRKVETQTEYRYLIPAQVGTHDWVEDVCSYCGLTRRSYVKVDDPTTLADGEGIVIYYPTESLLLSAAASGKKMAGVAATVTDKTVGADNGDELFLTVRKSMDGDYFFQTEDGRYLTSGETGSSLYLADTLTGYALWYFDLSGTNAPVRVVNRSALYNEKLQALEYYSGFTTYGIQDSEIYSFDFYRLEGYSAHVHTWGEYENIKAPTCLEDGEDNRVCATCGEKEVVILSALGHDLSAGEICGNCNQPIVKAQYTETLAEGDTIVIYNPKGNSTLSNTPSGYHLAGVKPIECGNYLLKGLPETVVWTVEVVDAEAGTYRFKTAEGVYLQSNSYGSFSNSETLPDTSVEGTVDYSVWKLSNGVNLINVATNRGLEYYGTSWQTYRATSYGDVYAMRFYKTNVEKFCEHNYTETVITEYSCTSNGESRFDCGVCGDSYTDFRAAPGHLDRDIDDACDACGEAVVNVPWALSTTAPTAGNLYVIVAHNTETDTWYALTTQDVNSATSTGREVLVVNNVLYNPEEDLIFAGRDCSYKEGDVIYTGLGLYESGFTKCIHLNSSKIRVTANTQNGVFEFTPGTTENTFTMLGNVNTRYLTFSGQKFGVGKESGTELYFFYQPCAHETTYQKGAVGPTCTETGCTNATLCSWCNVITVPSTELPANGHKEKVVSGLAANCTETGLTEGKVCSVCGDTLLAQEEIPAAGHTETIDASVAPGCMTSGLTQGSHCSVCGDILLAQQEIAPTGHMSVVDAAVAPTCDTTGLTEGLHCTTCGVITVAQEVVDALGHAEEVIPAVPATCTESGLTEGKKCTTCGDVLVEQAVVDATGHVETETVTVDATCTEAGTVTITCACGEVVSVETLAPLGHKEETLPAVPATCTESGLTEGKKCTACGDVLVEQEVVDATGHVETETVTVDATCTEAGTVTITCACGEVVSVETLAPLGHIEAYADNADGTHDKTCSVCHELLADNEAHSYADGKCLCGAEENKLVFLSNSLSLQSYIGFNCMVKNELLANYDSWYVVFERDDAEEGTVRETVNGTAFGDNLQQFEYRVYSFQMTDSLSATLYGVKDGVTYTGESYTTSVRDLAMGRMLSSEDAALKAMIANMLNYGAKAQIYRDYRTDDLADRLLGENASYVNTGIPVVEDKSASTSNGLQGAILKTHALGIGSSVELQFVTRIAREHRAENLYAELTWTKNGRTESKTIDGSEFVVQGDFCTVVFDGLTAEEGRSLVSCTVYDKTTEEAVSETWTCSIASYVAKKQKGSGAAVDTLNALMNYYDAAENYFK